MKVTLKTVKSVLIKFDLDDEDLNLGKMKDEDFANLSFQNDLMMDSLEFVLFQMEIEKECNVSLMGIPEQELRQIDKVQDFISLCEKYL